MKIIAQCPICKSSWFLEGKNQDRRVRCKKCGRTFRIPRLDELPKAADVIKRAKTEVYVDESGKTFG